MTADLARLLAEHGALLDRLAADLRAAQARQAELAALIAGAAPAAATATAIAPAEPPPSPPAPAPAADPLAAARDALCAHLEGIDRQLRQAAIGVDPADAGFLVRARQVLASAGDAAEARLIDLLGFIDRLGAAHPGAAYAPLHAALAQARRLWMAAAPGLEPIQIDAPAAGVRHVRLPGGRPLIIASGLRRGGAELSPAVAGLPAAPASVADAAAWGLLEECWAALRQGFRKALKDDLLRCLGELSGPVSAEQLRGALNLHTRHLETDATPAAAAALEVLRGAGLRAYALAAGDRFDPDRHDLKRFDRVARPGAGAPGTVIGLRQIGLAGPDGLPVQKCIAIAAA